MLAEFVPLFYYPISEPIVTYIFPVSEFVLLETICSCSDILFDYENLIYVPFVETLLSDLPLPFVFLKSVNWGVLIYPCKLSSLSPESF